MVVRIGGTERGMRPANGHPMQEGGARISPFGIRPRARIALAARKVGRNSSSACHGFRTPAILCGQQERRMPRGARAPPAPRPPSPVPLPATKGRQPSRLFPRNGGGKLLAPARRVEARSPPPAQQRPNAPIRGNSF